MPDEFSLIERFFQRPALQNNAPSIELGIGDDAVVLVTRSGERTAVTTDTLNIGVHFSADVPPESLGWKSLAVSLSDLAAMGATPRWFTLAISLPTVDESWLAAFSRGLFSLANRHRIALVGGDTTSGPLSITITAAGTIREKALSRSGAEVGDVIAVTGRLGDAALALHQGESAAPALLQRLHRPIPRVSAGQALAKIAHAAIDISDGLVADLGHILRASSVGGRIEESAIPRSAAFRLWQLSQSNSESSDGVFKHQSELPLSLRLLLGGGDDYELCVALPSDRLSEAQTVCASGHATPLTVIGEIVEQPGLSLLREAGAGRQHRISLPTMGWNHFGDK